MGAPLASVQEPVPSAGLPGRRAIVQVGPPLSCSGPSLASMGLATVPTRSPFTPFTNPLVPSLSRLWPSDCSTGLPSSTKFGPTLAATSVDRSLLVHPALPGNPARVQAPLVEPPLCAMVQAVSVRVALSPAKVDRKSVV